MRVLSRLLIVVFGIYFALVSAAQSPTKEIPSQPQVPFWTVLLDPVCPVTAFPGQAHESLNATSELRVMYFPQAKDAKLKTSTSLSLQIAFNGPHFFNNRVLVSFTRKGGHWEALVPLEKSHPSYAMFSIQDGDTSVVDDNGGKYWDVVFCRPDGEKDANGLMQQAESYSGETWPFAMRRETDFSKAVSLLETAIANNRFQTSLTLTKMWEYKAKRDGDTPATYAKLAGEMERYLDEHKDDANAQFGVGNFLRLYYKKLPPDFVDRTTEKLDANAKDPGFSFREYVALGRAEGEPDPQKRLAAIDQVIAQYPISQELDSAYSSRFFTCATLKDVACAESSLAKYREASQAKAAQGIPDFNSQALYLQMAELYAQQSVKPDAALELTDEAERLLEPMRQPGNEEGVSWVESQIAETRARIYLGMRKYDLALAQAQKAMIRFEKSAEAHFVLAQAYAAIGNKTKALEEYFNAALMPSNKDLEYRAELQSFYLAHFGNQKQFETALHKQIADRFQAANYVPKLLEQPAPKFEFTTLKGEKFDAANLNGKIVVINFWSPG
jgi:hypothetical protein